MSFSMLDGFLQVEESLFLSLFSAPSGDPRPPDMTAKSNQVKFDVNALSTFGSEATESCSQRARKKGRKRAFARSVSGGLDPVEGAR
jgi:hypothetical protein